MISVVDHRTQSYANFISDSRDGVLRSVTSLTISDHQIHPRASGKVRDVFEYDDHLIIVTTDRQSAFDRNIADVPFKGKSLNMLSSWWFSKTARIIPSAFIASPHPNVTIARKCKVFPVEFVVRGYITGSTATSIWMNYANGVRNYCGHVLPEGLRKHQKLDQVIITPTTKSSEHDALTSAQDLIAQGVMTQAQWDICAHHALTLFQLGQEICADRGLILVDTKYEFGVDVKTGLVRLVDEVHTPDSSRFWIAGSYESRMAAGEDPECVDKDLLRRWYVSHCDPYDASLALPEVPADLVAELSRRYIMIYEVITGHQFDFTPTSDLEAINTAVQSYFASLNTE